MERDQLRGSWGWGKESHVRLGHWPVARPQCPQPSAPAFSTFLGEDLSHSSRSDQNRMVSLVCPPWRHLSPIPVHFLRFCIFLFDQTNGTVVPISPSHPALDHIFSNSHRPGQFPCSLPRARYRQAGSAHLCQGPLDLSRRASSQLCTMLCLSRKLSRGTGLPALTCLLSTAQCFPARPCMPSQGTAHFHLCKSQLTIFFQQHLLLHILIQSFL